MQLNSWWTFLFCAAESAFPFSCRGLFSFFVPDVSAKSAFGSGLTHPCLGKVRFSYRGTLPCLGRVRFSCGGTLPCLGKVRFVPRDSLLHVSAKSAFPCGSRGGLRCLGDVPVSRICLEGLSMSHGSPLFECNGAEIFHNIVVSSIEIGKLLDVMHKYMLTCIHAYMHKCMLICIHTCIHAC
jgi:hypothetical protein